MFSFNLGVEIGQLVVVVLVASALAALRRRSQVAGRRLVLRRFAGGDCGGRVLVRAAGLLCWRGVYESKIVLGVLLAGGGAFRVARPPYQAQPPAAESRQGREAERQPLPPQGWRRQHGGPSSPPRGVVVVDTKNPGWGQPILDKIKEITGKPVTTIINTHTHGDHVSGNVEFPATVEVVVQENTKTNMEKHAGIGSAGTNIFKGTAAGLPKRTFKDKMTLGTGADRVDLYYFGRGHTNGDAFIVFPALRIAHAGDIFSGKNLPLLDMNNGGSGARDRQRPWKRRTPGSRTSIRSFPGTAS